MPTLCCSPTGAAHRGSPRQTQRDLEGSAAAANTNQPLPAILAGETECCSTPKSLRALFSVPAKQPQLAFSSLTIRPFTQRASTPFSVRRNSTLRCMETAAETPPRPQLRQSSYTWAMPLDIFKGFLQWAFLISHFSDKETEAQRVNYGGTGAMSALHILEQHFSDGSHTASSLTISPSWLKTRI